MQCLSAAWEQTGRDQRPLSLIIIDADEFKHINDSYGHDAGDCVLTALASQLVNAFRTDDTVCRMGGDEFMVICHRRPLDGARHVAELARRSVAAMKVNAGDGCWHGSISVGVAASLPEMDAMEALIKAADSAVYQAKKGGRNRVCG